jgi:peptide methionine sulfoxide reductase MsrA
MLFGRFQIVYDPQRVSCEEPLAVFWEAHNPVRPVSTQYRSAIFYDNEE